LSSIKAVSINKK